MMRNTFFLILQHIKRLLIIRPAISGLYITLRVIKSIAPYLILLIGQKIIDGIFAAINNDSYSYIDIYIFVALEMILVFILESTNKLIKHYDAQLTEIFTLSDQKNLMDRFSKCELIDIEKNNLYTHLSNIQETTSSRVKLFSLVFTQIQDIFTIILFISTLSSINPIFFLLIIAALLPALLHEIRINLKKHTLNKNFIQKKIKIKYYFSIFFGETFFKEIQTLNIKNFLINKFINKSEENIFSYFKIQSKWVGKSVAFLLMSIIMYYVVYAYLIFITLNKSITIGTLVLMSRTFNRLQGLLTEFISRFAEMNLAIFSLKDYYSFINATESSSQPPLLQKTITIIDHGIEFRDVSFFYNNSGHKALDKLNFHINPGEIIALVGENGSGKSTLLKMLARLYEPSEGEILINNVKITEYSRQDYYNKTSFLFQDFCRYYFSVKENIILSDRINTYPDLAVVNAVERSTALGFIKKLPGKFEQLLGSKFENSVDISLGQWQKIALSRFLIKDFLIGVLDEPTAHIDKVSENMILKNIFKNRSGKIILIATHSLKIIQNADRILFLKNGQIEVFGTNDQNYARSKDYQFFIDNHLTL